MTEQNTTLEALGSPVFVSRSSELYAWNEDTLLKLFREGIDPELIQNEEINTKETYEKGISQVACYGHVQVGGRTGILIRKIAGKTLISRAGGHPLSVFGVPKLMAQLQIKMHDTHTSKICCYKELVEKALETPALSFLTEAEQKPILKKNSGPAGRGFYFAPGLSPRQYYVGRLYNIDHRLDDCRAGCPCRRCSGNTVPAE